MRLFVGIFALMLIMGCTETPTSTPAPVPTTPPQIVCLDGETKDATCLDRVTTYLNEECSNGEWHQVLYIRNPCEPLPSTTIPTTSSSTTTTQPEPISTNKIKIAAFNIQVFGVSKAGKQNVMEVLSNIARNFDIIAIQEIRDASQTTMPAYKDRINSLDGPDYDFIISERLGRTTSKEQYAYLYNTQTIEPLNPSTTYPEQTDSFHREPYIAPFKAINGNFDFVLITIHADPDEATEEINALAEVVSYAKQAYQGEGDIIILGDLNADCSYFDEEGPATIGSPDYHWLIDNSLDTTTKSTVCTYDRIIITPETIEDYTGNSNVFRYDTEYGLTYDGTIEVSDHYPVYAEFWTDQDTDSEMIYIPIIPETTTSTTTITMPSYVCTSDYYNCGDFTTQAQAQAVYEACGGTSNDIHRLDGDNDGMSCESLK